MVRRLFISAFLLAMSFPAAAQYPSVTVRQIQEVPLDSLLLADSLQNSIPARWTLQLSPYNGDTVTVTALCVVPPKVLTYTGRGFTMLLYDTAAIDRWRGLLVRVNAPTDTAQIILDGFLNVERGDIITMTGLVSEFASPSPDMNSVTQFQPVPGRPITIIGSAQIPPPVRLPISEFYFGVHPGGRVRYSSGEPYEGMVVEFVDNDMTVDARVNTTRRTFSVVDAENNQVADYDASRYFTGGHTSSGVTVAPPDSIWALRYPVVGAKIDTLRGYITPVAGGEAPRGYRVSPLYYGDVAIGIVLPAISTHRRNPIVVPPDSAARISVRVARQTGGYPITGVQLHYSLNNAPFVTLPMTYNSTDTTYGAVIPNQPENTFIHYFVQAIDSAGNRATYASSAFGAAASDTSKGFFFYTVLNRPLTIRDLQYTPYANGRSPYLGAFVTVSGVMTGDTAHIGISPRNTGGTNAWYIQAGTQPWNGLWIVGDETTLGGIANGDSITVSGFVGEQFDVTRLSSVQAPVTVHGAGYPEPVPINAATGTFGPNVGNGTPSAEQFEGMLVRFNNVRVSSIDPVFSDPTEFAIDDGSGPILVRRDGTHRYSNVPGDSSYGYTILRVNDRISSLTGVLYYSFNRYKIVPRRTEDFGTITGLEIDRDPVLPASYSLAQNYPNPFNPSTTVEFSLPSSERVVLSVFNILGQEVQRLVDGAQEPGRYRVRMDASALPTGVYFYRLQAGDFTQVRKMMLLK